MPVSRHPLAQLIDAVKRDAGMSDEDIAATARRAGHKISKQRIANLREQDPLTTIVPKTLRALADGMHVPLGKVVEAALPSAGLPTGRPTDWTIEAAIDADPQLPLPAKRILLQLVETARSDEGPKSRTRRPGSSSERGGRDLGQPNPTGKAARRRT